MKRIALVLLTLLLALNATSALWGLTLEPLSQSFGSTGREAIRTFRVTNSQDQPVAVRLYMTTRSLTIDGREERSDASEAFLIFPARLLLEPGQSQAVRVQWRGEAPAGQERAFRLIAEQVPVRSPGGGEGVQLNFVYRYEGSVYVLPDGEVRPQVAVTGMTPLPAVEEGRRQVVLRIENSGGRHAILGSPRLVLNHRDRFGNLETIVLGSDALDRVAGKNLLAGSVIHQPVYLPESWAVDAIEESLDFETLQ